MFRDKRAHKPGIHENFLVTRKIIVKLTADSEHLVSQLSSLIGVDDVVYRTEKNTLVIMYDASVISIDTVLEIIKEARDEILSIWLNRVRIGWYRFSDKNVHDNAEHKPSCCNKPPPGY